MNKDAIEKYEEKFHQLKSVNKNAEKLRGHMYFLNGDLVAFVSIDIRSGKTWIDTLEVVKKYRGRHLAFQLLDVAVKKFHATDLRVHKDNTKAIGIFKTYGFKTYDKKNNWLYMSLSEDARNIDVSEDEKSQPIVKDLKSKKVENMKKKIANEAGGFIMSDFNYNDMEQLDSFLEVATESLFGKRSVEDLLKIARKNLIKSLKTESQCDIYLDNLKNESKKFNEAVNTLIAAQAKYNAGKLDKKEMNKTLKASLRLLNDNCKNLKIRLGDVVDDKKAISRQDIATFASYVKGLRGIVNEIKVARKKGIAIESAYEDDYDEDDFALEEPDFSVYTSSNGYNLVEHRERSKPILDRVSDKISEKIENSIDAADSKGAGYTAAKSLVKKIKKKTAKLAGDPSNDKLKKQIKELKARLEVINNKRKKAGYFAINLEGCCAKEGCANEDALGIDNLFEGGDIAEESCCSTEDILLNLSIDDLMALEASDLPDDEDGIEIKEEIEIEEAEENARKDYQKAAKNSLIAADNFEKYSKNKNLSKSEREEALRKAEINRFGASHFAKKAKMTKDRKSDSFSDLMKKRSGDQRFAATALASMPSQESFSLFDYNPQFEDYDEYDEVEEASAGVTYGPTRKVSKPTRRYYTEDGRRVYPDESDNIKRNDVTYGPTRKVSVPTGRYYTEDGRRVYPAKAKEGCKTREGCSAKEDAFGLFEDYDEYDADSYDNYDDYEDFE